MKNKFIIYIFSLFLIVVSSFVIHIYLVSFHEKPQAQHLDHSTIQFTHQLSSGKAQQVTNVLMEMEGVKDVLINEEKGTVVYFYDSSRKNSDEVFTDFMRSGTFYASQMKIKNAEPNSCMDEHSSSLMYKIKSLVKKF